MFDILVTNCCLVSMNKRNEILNPCDIGIENGIITAIGKSLKGNAEKIIDCTDKYVLPGFVNCHTHVYQSLI
ncbi:MAG: hypothetical protein KAH95_00345, partial [Spirochaetales bacterium]|nr:hypothetical protein [Spirochaetales bacterium]